MLGHVANTSEVIRPQPSGLTPEKVGAATRGTQGIDENGERGRLARSIWPQKGIDGIGRHLEIERLHGVEMPEAAGQVFSSDGGVGYGGVMG